MISTLFYILIFPGFLFLSCFGMIAEFIDRMLYARMQNRIGPPWFQPLADLIKLVAKEEVIPSAANPRMFEAAPLFAMTSTVCAFLYMPLWRLGSLSSFNGDLIVVLYLLTIPTLAFFIGGWYSTSLFARIGSVRSLSQLFAYEVPLFMAILSCALLANSWSFTEIIAFYCAHPGLWLANLLGFAVSLVALLGKLEKVPFDIPEAETEIVAGVFTEYSGRRLALLRLTLDIELVVGAALLAAIFLPFGFSFGPAWGFVFFIIKVLMIMALLSLCRSIFSRMRIDQMINFCWKVLVPVALAQLVLNLIIKGVLIR